MNRRVCCRKLGTQTLSRTSAPPKRKTSAAAGIAAQNAPARGGIKPAHSLANRICSANYPAGRMPAAPACGVLRTSLSFACKRCSAPACAPPSRTLCVAPPLAGAPPHALACVCDARLVMSSASRSTARRIRAGAALTELTGAKGSTLTPYNSAQIVKASLRQISCGRQAAKRASRCARRGAGCPPSERVVLQARVPLPPPYSPPLAPRSQALRPRQAMGSRMRADAPALSAISPSIILVA